MSQLSIRKLPKDIAAALHKEARRQGKTKTEIVIMALEKLLNLGQRAKRGQKLRSFFGKMSQVDYDEFRKTTADFELVDKDLWK